MKKDNFALLIDNHSRTFESLKYALRDLDVETGSVRNCQQAKALIQQCEPSLVFADASLDDGSWTEMLTFAERSVVPLNLIVVAGYPDTKRYLSVLDQGAFDFIVPPFERAALDFVVRSALLDVHRRREARARTAVA